METRREKTLLNISYAIMAVFCLYIAFCVPYCHDDWDWGLEVGLRQWLDASLNCRYVGNFFVVIMTRSEIVKTLIIAVTLFIIPFLISLLCGKREKLVSYLFANALIFAVPQLMWQQTHGWVAGFANYVVSAALTLFLVFMMEKSIKGVTRRYYLLIPLAAAQSLFIENLAVYSTTAFLAFSIACAIKNRRVSLFQICMTLASIAGTFVMFSGRLYSELLANGHAIGVRNLSFDIDASLTVIAKQVFDHFLFDTLTPFFYNLPLLFLVFTAILLIGGLMRRNSKRLAIAAIPYIYVVGFCAYLFFGKGGETQNAVLAVVYFIAVTIIICVVFEDRWKMLFFWISTLAILAPLSVTLDYGPRLFYVSYAFTAAAAVLSLPAPGRASRCVFGSILALVMAGMIIFYVRIYSEIRSITTSRAEAIEYAVENGLDTVYLKKDVHKYWWGRNPQADWRLVYFKEFYGIPKEMEVIFED